MSHGLEVFSDTGQARLRMESRITRFVMSRYLPAGETGQINIPYLSGKPAAAFAIKLVDSSDISMQKVGHAASVQGSVVSWEPAPSPTPSIGNVPSRLMVYVYA